MDDVELTRKTANALHFSGKFYGCFSPLEFDIKEMASAEVISVLLEVGYEPSKSCHDPTPFDGYPQELVDLWMKTNCKTRSKA